MEVVDFIGAIFEFLKFEFLNPTSMVFCTISGKSKIFVGEMFCFERAFGGVQNSD
jgi:hypothetical protein